MFPSDDFDWVSARSACCAVSMFESLKREVEKDVIRRVESSKDSPTPKTEFAFKPNGDSFAVIAKMGPAHHTVAFAIEAGERIVVTIDDRALLESSVTLCDDRICRLKIKDGTELERWQFRRRALEDLFFKPLER